MPVTESPGILNLNFKLHAVGNLKFDFKLQLIQLKLNFTSETVTVGLRRGH